MMRRWGSKAWVGGVAAAALASAPGVALAEVDREGDWPDNDPAVTLDVDGVSRIEAVNKLAAAAGWSIVVNAPKGDPVTVHVKEQPAGKVLDMLLADGDYVARREGTLISISPEGGGLPWHPRPVPAAPFVPPVPPVSASPAVPPVPPVPAPPSIAADDDSRDRFVTGGNLRIEKGEVVRDVTVMGGNVDVWGTVTGDLAVMGGNVRIHDGGHVHGDASAVGGTLIIESGGIVDHDVGVLGGSLRREEGAKVGGSVLEGLQKVDRHHGRHFRKHGARVEPAAPSKLSRLARGAADAVNGGALLFIIGAVLIALLPERMDKLKVQVASHPMRSFATGVVSLIAGVAVLAAMCVTVLGIPVAVVCALAAVLATIAALCSVLETVGAALLGHRTKNPYVHLALGALLFVVVGAIPFVGGLVKLAVVLTAVGSVVATRAAGLLPKRMNGASPYRDAAAT